MIRAEDRGQEDGRQDREMLLVGRMRVRKQMLTWKVFYELLRDKKENSATVSLSCRMYGGGMWQSESLREESGE